MKPEGRRPISLVRLFRSIEPPKELSFPVGVCAYLCLPLISLFVEVNPFEATGIIFLLSPVVVVLSFFAVSQISEGIICSYRVSVVYLSWPTASDVEPRKAVGHVRQAVKPYGPVSVVMRATGDVARLENLPL